MSAIDSLSVDEINNFPKLSDSSGKGTIIHDTIKAYTDRLYSIEGESFGVYDTSTAHQAILAVITEMTVISSMLENVDVIFDGLIETISDEIIDKEDQLSVSVLED